MGSTGLAACPEAKGAEPKTGEKAHTAFSSSPMFETPSAVLLLSSRISVTSLESVSASSFACRDGGSMLMTCAAIFGTW